MQHLVHLSVRCGMDLELARKVLEEIEFLLSFDFEYRDKYIQIRIDHHPKEFEVSVEKEETIVTDLNAVIAFIVENTPEE